MQLGVRLVGRVCARCPAPDDSRLITARETAATGGALTVIERAAAAKSGSDGFCYRVRVCIA